MMTSEQMAKTSEYIRAVMVGYHTNRTTKISALKPNLVLARKNPYVFLSKNLRKASDLAELILQAHTSSSEETTFGQILEDLAIYVSSLTDRGMKSTTEGIDLDFTRGGTRYLVAIKSGKNWGNSSQHAKLKTSFNTAKKVAGQNKKVEPLQPILGCCYGRSKDTDNGIFKTFVGQSFWTFLSGNANFYTDIIEPLRHDAEAHYDAFAVERDKALNRFERYILTEFCDDDGVIDWQRFVRFNSGQPSLSKDGDMDAEPDDDADADEPADVESGEEQSE